MAEFVDKPYPNINWEEEKYDLYGSLNSYNKTFNKFDDNKIYLSIYTREVISKYFDQKSTNFFQNVFTTILYLFDLFMYKIRRLLKLKI